MRHFASLAASLGVFALGCSSAPAPSFERAPVMRSAVASIPSGTVRYLPAVNGTMGTNVVTDATGLTSGDSQGKLHLSAPAAEAYARGIRAASADAALPDGATLEVDLEGVRQDERLGQVTLTSSAIWTLKRDHNELWKKITTRSAETRIERANGGLATLRQPSGAAATEQLEAMGSAAYREFLSFLAKAKPIQGSIPKDQIPPLPAGVVTGIAISPE